MMIYKNKRSKKYFIYLNDTGNDEALFVLPPNEFGEVSIKSLKLDLFDEDPEEDDEEILVSNGIITEDQLNRFRKYK